MSDVERNEHMLPIANWLREQINEVLARYDIPSDVYDYDILIDALCVCAVDKSQAAIRADLPPTDADYAALQARAEAAEAKLAKASRTLSRMAEGWSNALELGIIAEQHRTSAGILRDEARATLAEIGEGHD